MQAKGSWKHAPANRGQGHARRRRAAGAAQPLAYAAQQQPAPRPAAGPGPFKFEKHHDVSNHGGIGAAHGASRDAARAAPGRRPVRPRAITAGSRSCCTMAASTTIMTRVTRVIATPRPTPPTCA